MALKVDFFTTSTELNEDVFKIDYVKEFSDGLDDCKTKLNILAKRCKELGVSVTAKIFELEEILVRINENTIPIILIDANVIWNEYGRSMGHFVPIVGYDEDNVYVHQPGRKYTKSFMKINKELFDKARKAKCTENDVLFISRN